MTISLKPLRRAGLACVALGAIAISQPVLADGTEAGTSITNRATVNYQVGGVAQTPIESSPSGNSTPGLNQGANTAFVVDNKVDLTVAEFDGAATSVSSGQVSVVATFRVINEGNYPQGYSLSASNVGGTLYGRADAFDMANLRVRVSAAPCAQGATTAPDYDAVNDSEANIASLGIEECRWVFVVADTPLATNGQAANVQLTAIAREANTLAALTETAGAESPTTVDVVFADAGRDATESALDQFLVATAALSVAKTSTVISDPINLTTNPKAIPEAIVEYAITLTNTGSRDAELVTITDQIPANTTFEAASYAGGANVRISVGASDTFCTAEPTGDTNGDGCGISGGSLTVGAPAIGVVGQGAANAVTVRFRVSID